MQIISMDWAPGSPFYTIHCNCDTIFHISSGVRFAQCSNCGRVSKVHVLEREWIEITTQKRENQREKEVEED